jgi:hypothetical protein
VDERVEHPRILEHHLDALREPHHEGGHGDLFDPADEGGCGLGDRQPRDRRRHDADEQEAA